MPVDAAQTERDVIEREELIRFFSVLSHDLKSPIFSIDGFSDLLLADYSDKLDEEGKEFLTRVRSSAQQMRRVLDDMSHMVKLLARPDARRPVDLNELIDELRLKFNYLIEEGGVQLDVQPALPTVNADREKIREALGALLSNALFFNDRAKGERSVSISSSTEAGMVSICVADNGFGFDERYTDQIFELGLKLDKSRGGGPGYGLYLAKRIAETHGGKVTASSTLQEGSRFCLVVPAVSGQ